MIQIFEERKESATLWRKKRNEKEEKERKIKKKKKKKKEHQKIKHTTFDFSKKKVHFFWTFVPDFFG